MSNIEKTIQEAEAVLGKLRRHQTPSKSNAGRKGIDPITRAKIEAASEFAPISIVAKRYHVSYPTAKRYAKAVA